MSTKPFLAIVLVFWIAPIVGTATNKKPADAAQAPSEKDAQLRVRLQLNKLEANKLLNRYEALLERELSYQEILRTHVKRGDVISAQEVQQGIEDTKSDMKEAKDRLVALETERGKLVKALGNGAAVKPEPGSPLLERILERLDDLTRRLEKLENSR